MTKLTFTFGNAKLDSGIAIFSLPAGWSCIGAQDCLCRANRQTGKLTDGPDTKFRCYAASQEALYPNVRKLRWKNFLLLKGKSRAEMIDLIQFSLPLYSRFIRVHVGGDFFSQDYFDSWLQVARDNPGQVFYGYTKSLPFLIARRGKIPKNFRFVASKGGKFDNLIARHKLRFSEVVFSVKEAVRKKLKIDKDDSSVFDGNKNVALLLHGGQKAKSAASKAWQIIKTTVGGYSKGRKHNV